MNALDYFLKANLYGLLFVGCYWLLLRRHTFFSLNRAYLLLSAVLSLVLPVVSLPTFWVDTLETTPVPVQVVGVIALPVVTVTAAPVVANVPASTPDWLLIGGVAYGLVAAGLLLRLRRRVGGLLRLIRQSPRQLRAGYVLVEPNDPGTPTFSFFRYVVLNPADARNDLVIRHELVHVRQRHSLDVLGLTGLRAVFWAVPALWLIDRALRQVHEYLADQTASSASAQQPDSYARFLVEYTFGVRPDALTNGFFNPSLLKQRIVMLHQRTTSRWALGKYVLVLPLALGLLAMTTARDEITAALTQNKLITVSGRVMSLTNNKPLPGANIVVKGTSRGTTTDAEGRYTLSGLTNDAFIVVSFIGFKTTEIRLNGRTSIDVRLAREPNRLNDVFVTGYGAADQPTKPLSEAAQPAATTTATGEVFTVVEQQPQFPGGISELQKYLIKTLRYPAKARQENVIGTVLVRFTVTADGSIDDVYVEQGIGGGCNEEAVRLVSQMPRWTPGYQSGQAVSVPYVLPIRFSLDQEDKRTGQVTPPDSKTLNGVVSNHPNARFRLYNDVKPEPFTMDSLVKNPRAIRISGRGPLGPLPGDEPLYILNDEQISADVFKTLNPHVIQSIEVLKDASARSIYGEKAKNGAVIITTKKP